MLYIIKAKRYNNSKNVKFLVSCIDYMEYYQGKNYKLLGQPVVDKERNLAALKGKTYQIFSDMSLKEIKE